MIFLYFIITEFSANQTLDAINSVFGIRDALALRYLAAEQ